MQDSVNEGHFLFVQQTSFEKAFPMIEDISVKTAERGYGIYAEPRRYTLGKNGLGEYINCSNPSCKRGGFEISHEIRDMISKKDTERKTMIVCIGDEGSPKGRKIGRSCINRIETEIKIKYKEEKEKV